MLQSKRVIRTERIWIKKDPVLKKLTHISKNLYNEANYIIRQNYFQEKESVEITTLLQQLKRSENYQKLPFDTTQKIITILTKNWKSFFKLQKNWDLQTKKNFQQPQIPKYKEKTGAFLLPFSKHQITIERDIVKLVEFGSLKIKSRISARTEILGGRIIPKGIGYVVELLYSKNVPRVSQQPPTRIVGIDLGVTNLITMGNNIGKQPIVIKGGVVKSINQYYNKRRANIQQIYVKQGIKYGTKYCRLVKKRNKRINNFFHEVSCYVILQCKKQRIDTIVIGYNKNWKHRVNLGKRTNQNFYEVPFHRLIHMIQYKAEDAGIRVIQSREDYTSKCSFLDNEPIGKRSTYMGERIHRGLFRTKKGKLINSDANGAYNIIQKAVPNAFSHKENVDRIEGVWLHPVQWRTKG